MEKREFLFYKNYFREFYLTQSEQVKQKIGWTLEVLVDLERIPEKYLKHLTSSKGLYELRVQSGKNAIRIFCFFDQNDLVICHGFQKKTQKTPKQEIARAEKIKKEYYEKNGRSHIARVP
jgi:phage-related protein